VTDTFVDTDFCGTGVTIEGVFEGTFTDHHGPSVDFKNTGRGTTTLTNPATGASVTISTAGSFTDEIVAGTEGEVHTHAFTFKGLPEKIQTLHGPVLLRDAGIAVFLITFDENDEEIGFEVTTKGPHPDLDSDFALFCEVTTEALGIS
jgi:hypothetical protein